MRMDRSGRALLWLLWTIALLAAGAATIWLAGFSALFHGKSKPNAVATTAPVTRPAPLPPPKPIPLGKLDAFARFIPPEATLLAFIDVEQLVSHKLVGYFQDQFSPYLAEFHLAPKDIRQMFICGEHGEGFVAVRLRRDVSLNEIFDKPADPIQSIDGAPRTRAQSSFGMLLAAMPQPDLLVLSPQRLDAPGAKASMTALLSRKNRSGEFDPRLVDAIRTLDSQQAFVIFVRSEHSRAGQAGSEPMLESAGVTLSRVLQAKALLVYQDEKTAGIAAHDLRALKTDLNTQRDPLAGLAEDVVCSQDGRSVRVAGQWGITSILKLLISNPDPRTLAPSAHRIADRLKLLP